VTRLPLAHPLPASSVRPRRPRLARLRPELLAPLALCSLAALHALFVKPYASDFAVVHRAAARVLSGEALYRLSELNPFKYSPAAALLFTPLGALPMRAAHALWAALSALCTWRFLASTHRRAAAAPWASALASALVAPYVLHHFALGQCDAALLALAAFSDEEAERRPWRAGLALALAASIKAPMLALLVPAALFRQWRRLLASGLALAGLVALSAVHFHGLGPFAAWQSLLAATTPPMLCNPQNQSAWALACAYVAAPTSPSFAPAVALLGGGVAALLALAAARANRADPARARAVAFAAALFLTAFLSPLGWWTNLMACAPLLALLAEQTRSCLDPARRRLGAAALAAMALAGALNDDTVGRAWFEKLLQARHMGLAALLAALAVAWIQEPHPTAPASSPMPPDGASDPGPGLRIWPCSSRSASGADAPALPPSPSSPLTPLRQSLADLPQHLRDGRAGHRIR
jgi:hypothetical protein